MAPLAWALGVGPSNDGQVWHSNFFCSPEKAAAARLLEIPQWIFDAAAYYEMHLAPTPAICIETMLDLKRLVAQATSESHDADIRLRHRSAESAGGANAKRPAEWPISAVSDTLAEDPSVGGLPYEIRQRTVPLLARLLRQHYARSVAAKRVEEACDE